MSLPKGGKRRNKQQYAKKAAYDKSRRAAKEEQSDSEVNLQDGPIQSARTLALVGESRKGDIEGDSERGNDDEQAHRNPAAGGRHVEPFPRPVAGGNGDNRNGPLTFMRVVRPTITWWKATQI